MSGACKRPSSADHSQETDAANASGTATSSTDFGSETKGNPAGTTGTTAGTTALPVTLETFEEEVLRSDQPVAVYLYANASAACREIEPTLDRLVREFAGKVKFVKVNVDEEPELAEASFVTSQPTVVLFDGGERVGQLTNLSDRGAMRSELESLAANRKLSSR